MSVTERMTNAILVIVTVVGGELQTSSNLIAIPVICCDKRCVLIKCRLCRLQRSKRSLAVRRLQGTIKAFTQLLRDVAAPKSQMSARTPSLLPVFNVVVVFFACLRKRLSIPGGSQAIIAYIM